MENSELSAQKCLSNIDKRGQSITNLYDRPVVDAVVVDVPAFVRMNPPRLSKTYGEYCKREIGCKLIELSEATKRFDMVFDMYNKSSFKRQTREPRGKGNGVRVIIKEDTQIMAIDENNQELFVLMASMLTHEFKDKNCVFVGTQIENIVSSKSINKQFLTPCFKE